MTCKKPRRGNLPQWAKESLIVALAFVCGAVFGIVVTWFSLWLGTAATIEQTRREYYKLGREYERYIWDRFGTVKEKN